MSGDDEMSETESGSGRDLYEGGQFERKRERGPREFRKGVRPGGAGKRTAIGLLSLRRQVAK